MSDSDDTDILLLIPPDFFVTDSNLDESVKYDQTDASLIQSINTTPKRGAAKNILVNGNSTIMDKQYHHSSNYRMSPPMGTIKKQNTYSGLNTCHLTSHSKGDHAESYCELNRKTPARKTEDNYLREIDNYLAGYSNAGSKLKDINSILLSNGITPLSFTNSKKALAKPDGNATPRPTPVKNVYQETQKPSRNDDMRPAAYESDVVARNFDAGRMSDWNFALQQQNDRENDEQLVNLNQIWNGDNIEKPLLDAEDINEEQLRRRQFERQIQSMQDQIKEYQEKFSVTIKMDQTKNEALTRLHETNSRLIAHISKLEQSLANMEIKLHREKDIHIENNDLKMKVQLLDRELFDAVKISKLLQEKNQVLEGKVDHLLHSANEIRELNRKQLDEVQVRLSNSKHTEDLLNNEILQLKNEIITIQNKSDEILLKEKNRGDDLESENKAIQQKLDSVIDKEKDVVKELEMQRLSLKSYYQTQLEQVVGDKLKEFQKQMDAVEGSLKVDARKNERLIAERAIKQIELINQKNEQEFALMEEKHKQEIELYHLRLENATKTISQMEEKLKAKRNEIAKRLHNVIESQWQQTLEIISNPQSGPSKLTRVRKANQLINNSSELALNNVSLAGLNINIENENFETTNTFKNHKINGANFL